MKNMLSRVLTTVILTATVVLLSNCGDDGGDKTAQQTQLEKLSKTWTIAATNGARLGTTDRTSDFTGFTLTISGTYNSSNPDGPYNYSVGGSRPTPSPWPASGTWLFTGISGNTGTMQREPDDVIMSYSITSSNQLIITFECDGCDFAGSRMKQVDGVWTFTFN